MRKMPPMNNLFLASHGIEYSYQDLIRTVNEIKQNHYYVNHPASDPYSIFSHVLHSMTNGYEIEVFDGSYSTAEIRNLEINLMEKLAYNAADSDNWHTDALPSLSEMLALAEEWRLSLYTSGTTGKPKKVKHNLRSLTRNVRVSDKHANDVWLLAYNPSHIAGIQIFFQAVFNRNPIIYAFQESSKRQLGYLIDHYKVSHISATASYYRNVLHMLTGVYPTVQSVTFGGEKYDPRLEEDIRKVFPNAQILNIYASTEAGSLFTGRGESFCIPSYLIPYINISEDGQLFVHHTLLGDPSQYEDVKWYGTGDIVERVDEDKIRFVSRKSELINVGGYKVNPLEVESLLYTVPGVVEVVVSGKSNSVTGSLVVADIVMDPAYDENELTRRVKATALEHLQPYKVPRIINIVDQLAYTKSGKKNRT